MDDLYQEIILDSAQSPANRGNLRACEHALHEHVSNPLCGDTVELWIHIQDGVIKEAKFEGEGCTISQAAASLLTEEVRGKTAEELKQFISDYQAFLGGSLSPDKRAELGPLLALEGVRRFPMRMRCAMLAFEALRRLLK